MGVKINNVALKSMTHDGYKVKKWTHNNVLVYSSGSDVTYRYYDVSTGSNTVIGTKEVEEGLDVLHPSLSYTKTGYTLVGYNTTPYAVTGLSSLVATGDPMTLYAIYVPNTLTVLTATISGTTYVVSKTDAYYLHYITENSWYANTSASAGTTSTKTAEFTLTKNAYQNAKITFVGAHNTMSNNQWFDDNYASDGVVVNDVADGKHTFKVNAIAQSGTAYSVLGIGKLELSNPTAWT